MFTCFYIKVFVYFDTIIITIILESHVGTPNTFYTDLEINGKWWETSVTSLGKYRTNPETESVKDVDTETERVELKSVPNVTENTSAWNNNLQS